MKYIYRADICIFWKVHILFRKKCKKSSNKNNFNIFVRNIYNEIFKQNTCRISCIWKFAISHCYVENTSLWVPSQNIPVQWLLHPLSHLPVDLLQGTLSLHTPWHLTHFPSKTYVPSLQTINNKRNVYNMKKTNKRIIIWLFRVSFIKI